jgi:hypothetical protein
VAAVVAVALVVAALEDPAAVVQVMCQSPARME